MRNARWFFAAIVVVSLVGVAPEIQVASAQTSRPADTPLGPNGGPVEAFISESDVKLFAEGFGMSFQDTSWLMREGTTALYDFQTSHALDERFGAVWTTYKPLTVHLRLTKDAPDLVLRLSKTLGRPVNVTVGGGDYSYLLRQHEAVSLMTSDVMPQKTTLDHVNGTVVFETNERNAGLLTSLRLPPDVPVVLSDIEPMPTGSYANAPMNASTCSTGYAVRRNSDNWRGVVTAGHCPANNSSYGHTLWPQEQQTCAVTDRQVHPTTAPYIWNGFFNLSGQRTAIAGVAGGWLNNQPFTRKGVNTSAGGNIGPYVTRSFGGGDCGGYNATGFELFNSSGAGAIPGDSGGPLMLAYANQWFLAGTTTGVATGAVSGFTAWISVPSGWTACTGSNPSCVG